MLTRRTLASCIAGAGPAWTASYRTKQRELLDLSALPNFCAHEHWGSIDSIGIAAEGFRADVERGASPRGRTGVLDLFIEPYFRGWLAGAGTNLDELAKPRGITFKELAKQSAWEAFSALRSALAQQRFTGIYQCTRRGLLGLYGIDLNELNAQSCSRLDEAIARNYASHFGWYL